MKMLTDFNVTYEGLCSFCTRWITVSFSCWNAVLLEHIFFLYSLQQTAFGEHVCWFREILLVRQSILCVMVYS